MVLTAMAFSSATPSTFAPSSCSIPRPSSLLPPLPASVPTSLGLSVVDDAHLSVSRPCSQLKRISCSSASMRPVFEARLGGGGGAGVLERPGLDQSQSSPELSVQEGGEMGRLRRRVGFGGGDRYRVLLLDHERHTESQVATVLPKVVPSVTPDEARRCFRDSREKGAGLVTVAVKEHAEFYAQMMARCGLRSSIEPDTDTL